MKQVFVTITFRGRKATLLMPAWKEGKVWKVDVNYINRALDRMGVRRGDTYTIG
jgi:hypothetical protein